MLLLLWLLLLSCYKPNRLSKNDLLQYLKILTDCFLFSSALFFLLLFWYINSPAFGFQFLLLILYEYLVANVSAKPFLFRPISILHTPSLYLFLSSLIAPSFLEFYSLSSTFLAFRIKFCYFGVVRIPNRIYRSSRLLRFMKIWEYFRGKKNEIKIYYCGN